MATGPTAIIRHRSPVSRWVPWFAFLLSACALLKADSVLLFFGLSGEPMPTIWRNLCGILLWLFSAVLFNQLARLWLWDGLLAGAMGRPVPGVMKEISALLVYFAAFAGIASFVFDQSVTGFLAALGAFGVVVGFGLRDLFADVFTGLAINIDQTFAIGDWVEINEGSGEATVARISEIGWRSTILTTEEQTTVVVPNGMLGRERVVNISQPVEPTRYEVTVTVEFAVPAERVRRVLLAALIASTDAPGFERTLAPTVLISDTSSLGIQYLLRYWILPWHPISPASARDHVMTQALRFLRIAGISLAYRKADVYHAPMPERQVLGHSNKEEILLLSHIKLFKPLLHEELEQIVSSLVRRKVGPDQVLVCLGEEGETLFVLIEGLLDVEVEVGVRMQRVARIEPGECFGEMSLLTGERRSATVRSVTTSVTYEIGREPLQNIMRERPEVAMKLARILAQRQLQTRQAQEQYEETNEDEAFESFARQMLSRMRDFLGGRK